MEENETLRLESVRNQLDFGRRFIMLALINSRTRGYLDISVVYKPAENVGFRRSGEGDGHVKPAPDLSLGNIFDPLSRAEWAHAEVASPLMAPWIFD